MAFFALSLAGCDDTTVPAAPGGTGASGGIIILPPPPGTGGTGAPGSGGMAATGGNGAGTGGMSGAGGTGGGSGIGGTGGIVDAGTCTNEADFLILTSLGDPAIVRSTSANCSLGFDCAPLVGDQVRFVECVAACVRLEYGLTEECAACYGDLEWCSSVLCATECAGDGSDAAAACSCPATLQCQAADYPGCLTELLDCTGTIPRECLED